MTLIGKNLIRFIVGKTDLSRRSVDLHRAPVAHVS